MVYKESKKVSKVSLMICAISELQRTVIYLEQFTKKVKGKGTFDINEPIKRPKISISSLPDLLEKGFSIIAVETGKINKAVNELDEALF